MDYFKQALFLLLIGAAASEWTTVDGRTQAIRCFNQIMTYGDITNLLIDVTTPEAIDDFCRQHGDLLKCTKDNEHTMTVQEITEYQKNITGVNNFYVQVCPPGTDITAAYKENAACFKIVANQILYCGSDLPDVNSYRMRNDLHYRCCALEQHRECVKRATGEKCGKPAADVAEMVLLRYFDRQIKFCNTPSHGCEYSGPSGTDGWTTARAHTRDVRHSTPWHSRTTPEDKHLITGKDWRRATAEHEKPEWEHATEASPWKKQKHNSAATGTLHFAMSVTTCLLAILMQKY